MFLSFTPEETQIFAESGFVMRDELVSVPLRPVSAGSGSDSGSLGGQHDPVSVISVTVTPAQCQQCRGLIIPQCQVLALSRPTKCLQSDPDTNLSTLHDNAGKMPPVQPRTRPTPMIAPTHILRWDQFLHYKYKLAPTLVILRLWWTGAWQKFVLFWCDYSGHSGRYLCYEWGQPPALSVSDDLADIKDTESNNRKQEQA